MPEKTLKIKKVFVWTIYNSLKNTAPKEFPTTGEIKETITSILPTFKAQVTEYIDLVKKISEAEELFDAKKINEDELKEKKAAVETEFKAYNKEHSGDMCELSLPEEAFKTLKAQFDRDNWGRKWVMNIEEFGELMVAFEEAAK